MVVFLNHNDQKKRFTVHRFVETNTDGILVSMDSFWQIEIVLIKSQY